MRSPHHDVILQHVVVVVAPTRGVAALEDQLSHGSANQTRKYTTPRKARAAHGYEATREAAMMAFAKSWRGTI